jgi:hypothetical protein
MKTLIKTSAFICSLLLGQVLHGQFALTGEYMNRAEFRNGHAKLVQENSQPAFFISQRARLGGVYTHEKFKFNFSAQDIRTWGNTSNVAIDTSGLLSVFNANVELFFTKKFSAKIGRQDIAYDDHRIFGSLDWLMQARRHDAAIFRYEDSTVKVHTGFAFNQRRESASFIPYGSNQYQNFQFLWANKKMGKANISFLFLNNGVEFGQLNTETGETSYSTKFTQTIGLRGERKGEKFHLMGYGYYQMGEAGNKKVSALDASFEVGYKPIKNLMIKIGTEYLSGTSQVDTANKVNNSFNPFYGTNHRFNGYMDYFYVGNHGNSVGLVDNFLKVSYSHKDYIFGLAGHYFSAAADVRDLSNSTAITARDRHLGAEIDFTALYNFTDGVSFQAGYSHMFGTGTLQTLKGGTIGQPSNWAYLMVIVRPEMKQKFPKCGLNL